MIIQPNAPLPLLGGLTPAQFMRRHWQRQPLLVRQALADVSGLNQPKALLQLAAREEVSSRLIEARSSTRSDAASWRLRHGPFGARSLPPQSRPGWTILVQAVDTQWDAAHALLRAFRFVPDARLDDLMISFASTGGGVGPHVDSYDVFLLQTHGRRRWRIGAQKDLSLVPGLPLKILARFEPTQEYVLEPGDMLYLPPHWAHEGVALDPCMTCSIGFRSPARDEIARDLLQRVADMAQDESAGVQAARPSARSSRYRDPGQPAVTEPARIPEALAEFAFDAIKRLRQDPQALALALGERLTEPRADLWFSPTPSTGTGVALDRATRMLYDERHVYINGEAFRLSGKDARVLRQLADERYLSEAVLGNASAQARACIEGWREAGWVHGR